MTVDRAIIRACAARGWSSCLLFACAARVAAQDADAEDDAPFVAPAVSAPASALGPPQTPAHSERFSLVDGWIQLQAAQAMTTRVTNGALWAVGGFVAAAIETTLLAALPVAREAPILLGESLVLIAVGLIEGAVGVFNLVEPSVHERRLARWRASAQDEAELARMEGELRDERARGVHEAYERIAIGSGLLGASVVGAVLTAVLSTSDDARWLGYLGAGVVGVLGGMFAMVPAIAQLAGGDAWSEIERGHRAHASLVPWASPWGGGATLSATF